MVSLSVGHRTVGGDDRDGVDDVAVEAPLEVRFAGVAATVLLRTPGDDEALVHGFLLAEGLLSSAADIVRITRPDGLAAAEVGNVVDVTLVPALAGSRLDRPLCSSVRGACSRRSIAASRCAPSLPAGLAAPAAGVLAALPARMRAAQAAVHAGGVHALGLFTADGALVALREDVGRHNAVDKVVGAALMEGRLPLTGHVLVVSGRISFELAQKAVVAGAILAGGGAPSSMAVGVAASRTGSRSSNCLPGSLNVYGRAHGRLTGARRLGSAAGAPTMSSRITASSARSIALLRMRANVGSLEQGDRHDLRVGVGAPRRTMQR